MFRTVMFALAIGLASGLAGAVIAAPPTSRAQLSPPPPSIGCPPAPETAAARAVPDPGQEPESDEERLGDAYWQGSPERHRNPTEAVSHYKAAALHGSASAARKVAIAYANGEGVAPDDAQMLRWTRTAVCAGDAEAAGMLGYAIMIGIDGTYDLVEAAAWLTLASEKAHSTGWRARAAAIAREAESKLTRSEQEALNARLARWRSAPNGE